MRTNVINDIALHGNKCDSSFGSSIRFEIQANVKSKRNPSFSIVFNSLPIHFQFTNKSSLNRVTFILLPPHQSVLKKYLERRRSKVSAFQIVPNKNKTPPKKTQMASVQLSLAF